MTIYPEVQKKAQAELDAVIGSKRLPTMEDRDALPYVNAICKELLRWHVVVPMRAYFCMLLCLRLKQHYMTLAPHAAAQDIVYEGYLIPKGTVLLPNAWFVDRQGHCQLEILPA